MDDALGRHDLELTRRMQAGRAAIWRCLTEPALIEQWFCPRPWRATDVVIDLRPGGRFSTVMRGPAGEVFDEGPGCILLVEPQTRLVWTSALGPGWRPNPAPEGGFAMTAVMTLRDAEGGGTLYTARALHATPAAKAQHEAMGFHDGWGAAADQLQALAAAL
jgi:uncharacterized protein YndB with AHSA1/START domain